MNMTYFRELPYETRNLGLPSFDLNENDLLTMDSTLLTSLLQQKDQECQNSFIQTRFSKQNLKLSYLLGKCAFYFVEVIVTPQTTFKNNLILENFIKNKTDYLPKRYKLENFKLYSLDKQDINKVIKIKEIAKSSFSDDRFHLDFKCSKQIADQRFSFWVDDLLENDQVTFDYLSYLGNEIAFMARNEDNLILAGFSANYVNSGLGDFFWLSVLEKMITYGYKKN